MPTITHTKNIERADLYQFNPKDTMRRNDACLAQIWRAGDGLRRNAGAMGLVYSTGTIEELLPTAEMLRDWMNGLVGDDITFARLFTVSDDGRPALGFDVTYQPDTPVSAFFTQYAFMRLLQEEMNNNYDIKRPEILKRSKTVRQFVAFTLNKGLYYPGHMPMDGFYYNNRNSSPYANDLMYLWWRFLFITQDWCNPRMGVQNAPSARSCRTDRDYDNIADWLQEKYPAGTADLDDDELHRAFDRQFGIIPRPELKPFNAVAPADGEVNAVQAAQPDVVVAKPRAKKRVLKRDAPAFIEGDW